METDPRDHPVIQSGIMMEENQKCAFLKEFCSECRRQFRNDERYIDCPDCGASRQCKNNAMIGKVYCHLHGGKSKLKRGIAAIQGRPIVTGSSSTSPVAKLASKYIQMQKSGPIQSNRAILDTLDTRIQELLDRIEENYSEKRIKTIITAWEQLKRHVPGLRMWVKDNPEAKKAYLTLDTEVEKAYHDYESWKQIGAMFDLRRKVSVDEMKILKDMQALISAEDAYELAAQLLSAVLKVLGEEPNGPKYIKLIHGEFATILGEDHAKSAGGREQEIIDIDPSGVDRT